MAVVTKDATSGKWIPQSASEYTSLLSGTGISNPSLLWMPGSVASGGTGTVPDLIGTFTGANANTANGAAIQFQDAVSGWSTPAMTLKDGQISKVVNQDTGLPDISATSMLAFSWAGYLATPTVERSILTFGPSYGTQAAEDIYLSGALFANAFGGGGGTASTVRSTGAASGVIGTILQINHATSTSVVQTPTETLSHTTTTEAGKSLALGGDNVNWWFAGGVQYVAVAAWFGTAAELTATQRATLIDRHYNGPAISSIAISPTSATLAPAATQPLVATSTRVDTSTVVNTAAVTWASSNTAVATVSSSGVVTAVGVGSANITCTYTSLNAAQATSNTSVITVSSGVTLSSITVTPASPSIAVGSTRQLTATGTYSDSSTADLTATATWTSAAPSKATVSATGLVTGVAAGTSVITATSGAVSGNTTATVSAITLTSIAVTPTTATTLPGASITYTAIGTYSDASTANLTATASWTSSNPSVATVSVFGVALGVTAGTTTIAATVGAVSTTATCVINPATGVVYNGRLEALINIPAGVSMLAANAGGGYTFVPLVQGAYYMTDLLAHTASQLNTQRPGGTWTLGMSIGVGGTGRVTINCTGGAWSIQFTSLALRQVFGFTGDIAVVVTSQIGAQQARGVWLPDCPIAMDQDPMMSPRETDLRVTESPTGVSLGWFGNSKYVHANVRWSHVTKNRVAKIFEVIPNQSWETFLIDTQWGIGADLAGGLFKPQSSCRIYDLAGNPVGTNLTYGWALIGVDAFKPKMVTPGHTNLYAIEVARIVSASVV